MTEDAFQNIDLTVIVAAYNEAAVLADSLQRITAELDTRPQVSWELVVVDDGSGDDSLAIMERFARRDRRVRVLAHRRNYGQGRAIRTAFAVARGRVLVTLDADLSYTPDNIFRLMDALEQDGDDIVLASPYTAGGEARNVPPHRLFLSRWGNRYLARMGPYRVSTSTCVVRAYRADAVRTLYLDSDGMEMQIEVLMKAALAGLRVREIPARLEWSTAKSQEGGLARSSKMRIVRSVRKYLELGWLSRPALLFMLLSLLFILPGVYMAFNLAALTAGRIWAAMEHGLVEAVSMGLNQAFSDYTYSFAISAALVIFGFQMLGFALLVFQNKMHYESLYRLTQSSLAATGRGDYFVELDTAAPAPGDEP